MTLGKTTFGLNKSEFSEKLGRIITNHRANSRVIGESAEFILRACRLVERWGKLAGNPDVRVYLRNVGISGVRNVKMLSLEVGKTKQPVSKAKLVDAIYPPRKITTSATEEEKHYNAVRAAMRNAIRDQIKDYRKGVELPQVCYLTGTHLRKGTKTDVDHVGKPFSQIADEFFSEKQLTYTEVTLVGPPNAKRFRDAELWSEWKEFHRENARFALVSSSANRAKGSDGYVTDEKLVGSFVATDPNELSLDF